MDIIQFRFNLSAIDATNLFDILNSEKAKMFELAQEEMSKNEGEHNDISRSFNRHGDYIEFLKQKMTNRKLKRRGRKPL